MSVFEYPLDVEQIQELLLHRYPFLMIDRVLEFTKEPLPTVTVCAKALPVNISSPTNTNKNRLYLVITLFPLSDL